MSTHADLRPAAPEAVPLTPDGVRRAVAGEVVARRRIVTLLMPVVRVRVARALYRFGGRARGRNVAQEADDLTQEIFVALFADGAKVLASWDPARGMSLTSFVSLVADRAATRALMGRSKSPWADDPTEDEELDRATEESSGAEARLASREGARMLLDALRAELSPLGFRAFDLLFLQELDVDAARSELGMSVDAVYAWRSRITKTIRRLADELDVSPPGE